MKRIALLAVSSIFFFGCDAQVDAPVDADANINSNITVNNYGDINTNKVSDDDLKLVPPCTAQLESITLQLPSNGKPVVCSAGKWTYLPSNNEVPASSSSSSTDFGGGQSSSSQIDFVFPQSSSSIGYVSSSSVVISSSSSQTPSTPSGGTTSVNTTTVSSTLCGDMFCGPRNTFRVMNVPGSDYSDLTYCHTGYWWKNDDNDAGGKSVLAWPTRLGNEYANDAIDPVIKYCGGLCATYTLNKGILNYNPYVFVGFNVDCSRKNTDISSLLGLCVIYTSSEDLVVELGLGDHDKDYGYSLPELKIPATSQPKMVNASWGAFKQSWTPKDDYDNELVISGAAAAKMAAQIKFKTQNTTGTKGTFNVISIGSYNSCGNP